MERNNNNRLLNKSVITHNEAETHKMEMTHDAIIKNEPSDYDSQVLVVDPGEIMDEDNEEEEESEHFFIQDEGVADPLDCLKIDMGDSPLECELCNKTFAGRKHLNRHIKGVHEKANSVTCEECGKVLSDLDSHKRHLINVHKIIIPVLPKPDQGSPKISAEQKLSVDQRVALECPDCDQTFNTKTTLNLHRLKAHIVNLQPLNCPQCKQECEDLPTHMREQHQVVGIICPHCANVFSKKCTLNRHIEQVHLNIQIHKPATCPQCNKVFSKKGHLDRHIKIIHEGIKDYSDPCKYCGKVFTTRASLEPHIAMVHEGMRRKCHICNKVLSDLNKHMRTVHQTYRRKTKISQDQLEQSDELALTLQQGPAEKTEITTGNPRTTKVIPDVSKPGVPTIAHVASIFKPNIPNPNNGVKHNIPIVQNGDRSVQNGGVGSISKPNNPAPPTNVDLVTSIKHELGLSSGITLQKIVKPSSPAKQQQLPKLTYHGPRIATSRFLSQTTSFGSISLTPISGKPEKTQQQPRLKAPIVEISGSSPVSSGGARLTPPLIAIRK